MPQFRTCYNLLAKDQFNYEVGLTFGGIVMPFPVWLLIAFAFFYFAFVFWQYSNTPLREFTVRIKGEDPENTPIDEEKAALINDIQEDIQGYVTAANEVMSARYRIGAMGFIIAGLTAIVSIFIG